MARRVATLALLATLLGSCAWGWPNARYVPTQYTGWWSVSLTSDQCGTDRFETYTPTGGMSFSAYGERYQFDFRHGIQHGTAAGKAQEDVKIYTGHDDEYFMIEFPWFRIEFESSERGKGSWQAKDCKGEIELVKRRK